jgi:hypothetical protein
MEHNCADKQATKLWANDQWGMGSTMGSAYPGNWIKEGEKEKLFIF